MLAVVGPTATGKTALGVALAEAFEGEVISADSTGAVSDTGGLHTGSLQHEPAERSIRA